MKTIVTNLNLSPVTAFRTDWYDTPVGLRLKNCACNGVKVCLYHWYTEVKAKELPKSAYQHGEVEQPKRPNPKPKSDVRRDGEAKRTRPAGHKKPTKRA